MHIVLCLDDRDGILFNHRRVSSDMEVCRRVLAEHSGRLLMNGYSAKLFDNADICAEERFLYKATVEDTCFVEDLEFVDHFAKVSSVTIYRWNRHYPSDVKFPQELLANWSMIECVDFAGNSHDNITKERYVR